MSQDDNLRQLAADTLAHRMVLQILLTRFLNDFPQEHRSGIVAAILATAENVDHLSGKARDEFRAEFAADVTVRAQLSLRTLVEDAMAAVQGSTGPGSQGE